MKKSFFISVVFLFCCPAWLGAQQVFGLKDCFQAAWKRSETLANQQQLVIEAEENYHKALGAILPNIGGSYTYLHRSASDFTHSGNNENSVGQQTLKITADQPLFRGLRDFAALDSAKKMIRAQRQSRLWAGTQLYRDTQRVFFTRLAVEKDLKLLGLELDLYQKRIKDLQERVALGRSRMAEVFTVQSAAAILKAQREQVLGQLYVAKEALAFLTGLDPDIVLDDTDEVPSQIEPLASYQSQIPSRPDVAAAVENLKAFKSNVSVAQGAYLPSVDLLGNGYLKRPDLDKNGSWDMSLAVTLPIFTGGIISSDVKIAKAQERQSQLQLSQVKRAAEEEIRTLYFTLQSDLAQRQDLEEAFEISEKNYQANVKDYERNLVTNLDVLQAFIAYQDTQRSLEKIRYLVKVDFYHLQASAAGQQALIEQIEKQGF